MSERDCLVVIPARMESNRFPGKPLATCQDGLPLVWHTWHSVKDWHRAAYCLVATDSPEIERTCLKLDIPVTMTGEHPNGSERVFEVYQAHKLDRFPAWTINVQSVGIRPEHLDLLVSQPSWHIVTLATAFRKLEEAGSLNNVKVITSNQRAFYFTRSPLPCAKNHIGIYAFHGSVPGLISGSTIHKEVVGSQLAKAESLEQLGWMEAGFSVYVRDIEESLPAVNVPGDLDRFNATLPQAKVAR